MRKKENLAAYMAEVICQLEVEGRLGDGARLPEYFEADFGFLKGGTSLFF